MTEPTETKPNQTHMIDTILCYPCRDHDNEDCDGGWRLWQVTGHYFSKRPQYFEGYAGDDSPDRITYRAAMKASREDHSQDWEEYYTYCVEHGKDPLNAMYCRTKRKVKRRGKIKFGPLSLLTAKYGFAVHSFTLSGKVYTQENMHECPGQWLTAFEISKTKAWHNAWRFTGARSVNELDENYTGFLIRGGLAGTVELYEEYKSSAARIRKAARKQLRRLKKEARK